MEWIEFDPCPINEDCVQMSRTEDYMLAMRAEANRMMELLDKKFQNFPGEFRIRKAEHDFGSYLEIRYYFPDTEEGIASMRDVEENYPAYWSDDTPRYWVWNPNPL